MKKDEGLTQIVFPDFPKKQSLKISTYMFYIKQFLMFFLSDLDLE
ncbi:hypothetical protein CCA_00320 [Chlamydia caviae GPIC]|uniref:Uncharacterized protein n=1 Tax=Chlamydia caviae (strain ATCC VR-813 / DSM 19441 / 03DC25 / GPIC) TaxID=227941 RepID=Q823T5_CHLCV|nr:hypothetical protein CCA_00320 [Chlamydia caviae GPIC]